MFIITLTTGARHGMTDVYSLFNHGNWLRDDKRLTVDGNNDKGAFLGGRAVSAPPPHEQIPIKNAPRGVFFNPRSHL